MEQWLINLIYGIFVVGSFIVGIKVYFNSHFVKEKIKEKKSSGKPPAKQGLFDRARMALNDPDSLIAELDRHIKDQESRGVLPEQMSMLLQERDMLIKYAKNPYIQMVGEPIIGIAEKTLKGFGIKI